MKIEPHFVIFVILAVFHIWFWMKNVFRIPRYIHFFAATVFLLSTALILFLQQPQYQSSGTSKTSPMRFIAILLFPAIVYAVFVLHGGATEEPEVKKKGKESEILSRSEVSSLEQQNPFSDTDL